MLHIIDNFPIQLSFLQQMHSGDTIILTKVSGFKKS
jgi:hypothetical protein